MIIIFKRIELWSANQWDFYINGDCPNGCIIISLGLFGVTLLKSECVTATSWFTYENGQ